MVYSSWIIAASWTAYPISSGLHMVAAVVKPVLGVLAANPVDGGLYGGFQRRSTVSLGGAQSCFEFAPGLLDGREVGGVGRQK